MKEILRWSLSFKDGQITSVPHIYLCFHTQTHTTCHHRLWSTPLSIWTLEPRMPWDFPRRILSSRTQYHSRIHGWGIYFFADWDQDGCAIWRVPSGLCFFITASRSCSYPLISAVLLYRNTSNSSCFRPTHVFGRPRIAFFVFCFFFCSYGTQWLGNSYGTGLGLKFCCHTIVM